MKKYHKQSGNVLVIILITIVLLGSLTAMMSRNTASNTDTGSSDQARIQAGEIIGYSKQIEMAVQRLLQSGCSESQISFQYDADGDGNYVESGESHHNPNAPSDLSCHVLHEYGGGQEYKSGDAEDWMIATDRAYPSRLIYTASTRGAPGVGPNGNVNGSGSDLTVFLPNVKKEICLEINRIVGVANQSNGMPPRDTTSSAIEGGAFGGNFGGESCCTYDTSGGETDGQKTACFVSSNPAAASSALNGQDRYYFYHTLIAR